jgi:hypothetical protein
MWMCPGLTGAVLLCDCYPEYVALSYLHSQQGARASISGAHDRDVTSGAPPQARILPKSADVEEITIKGLTTASPVPMAQMPLEAHPARPWASGASRVVHVIADYAAPAAEHLPIRHSQPTYASAPTRSGLGECSEARTWPAVGSPTQSAFQPRGRNPTVNNILFCPVPLINPTGLNFICTYTR